MTRTLVSTVIGMTLVALPAVAQSSPSAASTIGAVDAGSVVDVDLGAGLFKDPLPFDVPFYLRGDRDAATTSVSARLLQFPDPVNCRDQEALFTAAPDAGGVVEKLGPKEKHKVILRDLGRATDTAGEAGKPNFLLLVPALPVNRSYCFRWVVLRDVTEPEVTKFLAETFQAVDEGLREAPAEDTRRAEAYQRLRLDLIDRVEALLAPNERLVAPQGSFFDRDTPLAAVQLAPHEQFTQILARQDARSAALATFRDRQAGAFSALSALIGSEAYRKVTQSLARQRATNASLDELLLGKPGALDLAAASAADLDEIAIGVAPGATPTNLDRAFAPADLGDRLTRLTATATGLQGLLQVVEKLDGDQALRAAAGLDDPDGQAALDEVRPLVSAAGTAVELVRRSLLRLQEALSERTNLIRQFVSNLRPEVEEVLSVAGSTLAGYTLRASWYVSADVGLGVAGEIDEIFGYMGANVYFRPVNKKAKLGPLFGPQKDFWKRFALVVGLPQEKMDEPGRLMPVIQDRPLVVGAGLRINDLLRMTVGGLVFEKEDPDPLVTSSDGLTATWFFSFSIDWDVKSNFAPVFKGLGLGQQGAGND